jgi:transposase
MMSPNLTPDHSAELWAALRPHVPARPAYRPKGGHPFCDDQAALRGILYLLREGCKWQKIPAKALDCPSGSTCWRRFRDWTAAGVWTKAHHQLLDLLGAEGILNLERVVVDSASVRAQKGGRTRDHRPWIAAKKAANATC